MKKAVVRQTGWKTPQLMLYLEDESETRSWASRGAATSLCYAWTLARHFPVAVLFGAAGVTRMVALFHVQCGADRAWSPFIRRSSMQMVRWPVKYDWFLQATADQTASSERRPRACGRQLIGSRAQWLASGLSSPTLVGPRPTGKIGTPWLAAA